jgi:hypothetical protein
MKFCEAMSLLKEGAKVTRQPWKGSMYFIMEGDEVKCFQPKLVNYLYNEDIMISDGWFVEGQQRESSPMSMTFCEIIPFLEAGRKARLSSWKDSYIYLDKSNKQLILFRMEMFPFIPDFESFTAQDWLEVS